MPAAFNGSESPSGLGVASAASPVVLRGTHEVAGFGRGALGGGGPVAEVDVNVKAVAEEGPCRERSAEQDKRALDMLMIANLVVLNVMYVWRNSMHASVLTIYTISIHPVTPVYMRRCTHLLPIYSCVSCMHVMQAYL